MPQQPPQSGTVPGETPIDQRETLEVMLTDEQSPETKNNFAPSVVILDTPVGKAAFPIEDIVCCAAEKKYAQMHTADEPKPRLVYHSLAELSVMLSKHAQFVRCHKSLVLNVEHCKGWRHHQKKDALARVSHGERSAEYKVSRTFKEAFIEAWETWMQKV